MAASPSPGAVAAAEASHSQQLLQIQDTTLIPLASLVPLDTQLLSPSLAEAFELPYGVSGGPDDPAEELLVQKDSQAKDLGIKDGMETDHGQSGAHMQQPQNFMQQIPPMKPGDYPYQRNMFPGAQQPMLGNFFPQRNPASMPQPGSFPMEAQDHQLQGFLRQQAGLPGPQMPPGYGGMSSQYNNWMDQSAPGGFNGGGNSGKHPPEPTTGSDPDNDDYQARALKRPRLVWTLQLHQRFVDAVEQLGLKNAVPKTIMQLMNVDGLTRENVASHLQKYRLQLRKDGGKGEDMVDEELKKEDDSEQPRLSMSEGFK